MSEKFICPICGNKDIHSIGFINGKPYCRLCIAFRGEKAAETDSFSKKAPIFINYSLSPEQEELSNKLVSNYENGIDTLVYAVTGSGKTEICLKLIKTCIEKGLKVGFAVPRRSVCIELKERFHRFFLKNSVVVVYGGHHEKLDGDLVCLTTHQLFRYEKYFDLLILDEIDAFPYKGNEVLNHFFTKAIKGHYVLLSATPSKNLVDEYGKQGKDVLHLPIRFHRHPMPVPKLITGSLIKLYYKLLFRLKHFFKQNKPVFIFVPTIEKSKQLALLLKLFFRRGTYINSKRENNDEIIDSFRKNKYQYLVTTAVLERGVTIKDLQVIVFGADNPIYDDASLIQISGRAGRKKEAPEGEVIFFAKKNNEYIQKAIDDIKANNQILQDMLQRNIK